MYQSRTVFSFSRRQTASSLVYTTLSRVMRPLDSKKFSCGSEINAGKLLYTGISIL